MNNNIHIPGCKRKLVQQIKYGVSSLKFRHVIVLEGFPCVVKTIVFLDSLVVSIILQASPLDLNSQYLQVSTGYLETHPCAKNWQIASYHSIT